MSIVDVGQFSVNSGDRLVAVGVWLELMETGEEGIRGEARSGTRCTG